MTPSCVQGMNAGDCQGIDKEYFPCNTEPCDMQVTSARSFGTQIAKLRIFLVVRMVSMQCELWKGHENAPHQVRQGEGG